MRKNCSEAHLEGVNDSFRDFNSHSLLGLNGRGAQVGCNNHIRPAHEGVVSRWWLFLKHIQRCASHNFVVQGLGQGHIIDDTPPGYIHNASPLLYFAEGFCAENPLHVSREHA